MIGSSRRGSWCRRRKGEAVMNRIAYVCAVCLVLCLSCSFSPVHSSGRDGGSSSCKVEKQQFGTASDGRRITLYTITNANGMSVCIMNYGATVIAVNVPDRSGSVENVTLHLDSCGDYLRGHPLFGSVVGRFANRIAGAQFPLDGKQHHLTKNAGKNHIHGGRRGFQKVLWNPETVQSADGAGVMFRHTSPDGHEGYPGTLNVSVLYKLTDKNELVMEYTAETDKPTCVNLTNHAYWNLRGAHGGPVFDHRLLLNADYFLPADREKIPTGELAPVKGTVMDFTSPHAIGSRIGQVEGRNYDHCYVLRKKKESPLSYAACLFDPESGRVMKVYTTQPGVQLYTARHLSARYKTKKGAYGPYHAVCLETQHFPDSPNKPNFPSTVLRPGETYRGKTVHAFSVVDEGVDPFRVHVEGDH